MQPALQGHLIQQPQPMMTQQHHQSNSNMLASKIPLQIQSQLQQQQHQQQQTQFFTGHLGVGYGNQTQLHQSAPNGLLDPSSFRNALGSQQNYSGPYGTENAGGKQIGSDK